MMILNINYMNKELIAVSFYSINCAIYSQFVIVIVVATAQQEVAKALEANVISTRSGALVHANKGKLRELPNDPTNDIKFIANVCEQVVVLANLAAPFIL